MHVRNLWRSAAAEWCGWPSCHDIATDRRVCAGAASGGSQGSLMAWLAAEAPDVAMAAAVTATAALWWPDESLANAAAFCRCAAMCATLDCTVLAMQRVAVAAAIVLKGGMRS